MTDYMAEVNCRATKIVLIPNCSSKAEAKRKLLEGSPDMVGIDFVVGEIFFKSARIELAEKTIERGGHKRTKR